jgi:hypothetical protein
VLIPMEDYKSLKVMAAPNAERKVLLSLEEAEAYSLKLINKWAKEKSAYGKK